MCNETLFVTTVSRRGNKCAQIFATNFGLSCSFFRKLKSEAHQALSILFQQYGVPLAIVCDNAKEMVIGKFDRTHKEASCHLKHMGPFTSWSKAAKREIKELKKGSGTKHIKSGTPKRLWDDCLELQSYIRSNTAHSIYKWDGEVTEIIMPKEMSSISKFYEFEWFKWVMFKDETAPYSKEYFKLGRYLGPSIDVGPFLMAKFIKKVGQVFHRSTYKAPTQEEWEQEECKAEHSLFMDPFTRGLALMLLCKTGTKDTPKYDPYKDKVQRDNSSPSLTKNSR